MEFCPGCSKMVDTDFDAEHFENEIMEELKGSDYAVRAGCENCQYLKDRFTKLVTFVAMLNFNRGFRAGSKNAPKS